MDCWPCVITDIPRVTTHPIIEVPVAVSPIAEVPVTRLIPVPLLLFCSPVILVFISSTSSVYYEYETENIRNEARHDVINDK